MSGSDEGSGNAAYTPEPRHHELGEVFFDPVEPTTFPEHILRHRNDRAAREVGLDGLSDDEWIRHFGQFVPLPDNMPKPLALRYHGHQFRAYNPDLGDGRGFLFAQLRDGSGRLLDLGTKGSGTTPWSRGGDGRLTLKGAVRELLATEMLDALQVETSRTFSIIETGEALMRGDEPSPTRSAVLVRLSHSHIRIGTFQRLAYHGEKEAIERLLGYCAQYLGLGDGDPISFLREGTTRVARMDAQWWAAGFVHGVLNTDNINVTGESFDYGPWRFLEEHDPGKVAAYFDQTGLYAFARQPEALSWNLARLAECLLVVDETARDRLIEVLESFPRLFERALVRRTHERLGLVPDKGEGASELVRAFYRAMRQTRAGHAQAFHDLVNGALPERMKASPNAAIYERDEWHDALQLLRATTPANTELAMTLPAAAPGSAEAMPYQDVETIWAAIADGDDWSVLERKRERMHALGEFERALASSCGQSEQWL